jgi:hypothetical protein|tara:strand:+ start:13 stop:579 length:567 start_codon:yes stop_codon:yes gene_type:complete
MCGGGGSDPKELESKEALAQQAANALQRYGQVFVPLENMFINDTKAMFEEGAADNAMAAAQNQTSAMYEQGLGDMQGAQFNMGLDPTSGRAKKESSALREAQARGMGLAGADAGLGYTDAAYQGLGNVIAMGQGLQSNAMTGNIDRMQNSLDRAGAAAKADFARSQSLATIAGTGTGIAAGGYGLGGG